MLAMRADGEDDGFGVEVHGGHLNAVEAPCEFFPFALSLSKDECEDVLRQAQHERKRAYAL
jgi:hypothetical protein